MREPWAARCKPSDGGDLVLSFFVTSLWQAGRVLCSRVSTRKWVVNCTVG